MKEIEKQMLWAIRNRRNWRCSNTRVVVNGNYALVYLFDNHIATIDYDSGKKWFNRCGWNSTTTKSRMIALGYTNLRIKNGEIVPVGGWYGLGTYKEGRTGSEVFMFVDDSLPTEPKRTKAKSDFSYEKSCFSSRAKRNKRQESRKEVWWSNPMFC